MTTMLPMKFNVGNGGGTEPGKGAAVEAAKAGAARAVVATAATPAALRN
ncbi:hypothetical protein ABZ934_28155 [Streptomyces sp. NPDC046557]